MAKVLGNGLLLSIIQYILSTMFYSKLSKILGSTVFLLFSYCGQFLLWEIKKSILLLVQDNCTLIPIDVSCYFFSKNQSASNFLKRIFIFFALLFLFLFQAVWHSVVLYFRWFMYFTYRTSAGEGFKRKIKKLGLRILYSNTFESV